MRKILLPLLLLATTVNAAEIIDLKLIAGGSFMMGSPQDELWRGEDETLHQVSVADFYLGTTEVSQQLYQEVMGQNPSFFQGADRPVENISWIEAITFCNRLSAKAGLTEVYTLSSGKISYNHAADGYRLPTEAEWEYACRAGTTTPFYYQKSSPSDQDTNFCAHYPYNIEPHYFAPEQLEVQPGLYRSETVPCASFSPNPFGLYDLHGNVAEWVYDSYNQDPQSPVFKIYRGGAWNDFAKHLRSAYRGILPPEQKRMTIGLRVARNAKPQTGVESSNLNAPVKASGKKLILYYSWSGNTRNMARLIAKKTQAKLIELKLKTPYSVNYTEVLTEAWQAQQRRDLPELQPLGVDLKEYDTIMLGYPLWWASIPRPIATLLSEHDFTGKQLVIFSSGGGGHLQQSYSDLQKLALKSHFGTPLEISYSGGSELEKTIDSWILENHL